MRNSKIFKRLAFLSVLLGLVIISFKNLESKNYKLAKETKFCATYTVDEGEIVYSENDYTKAIDENVNLTLEQKEDFKQLNEYLSENPYINKQQMIHALTNFKVKIVDEEVLSKRGVGAYYDFMNNEVYLDNSNYGSTHEGLHVTTDYFFSLPGELEQLTGKKNFELHEILNGRLANAGLWDVISNIGNSLNEGMTSLLDYEYCGATNTYEYNTIFVKMLCEIIGKDTVLKSYTTGNVDIIIDEVGSLLDSEDEAMNMISDIDDICEDIAADESFTEYEDEVLEVVDCLNDCSIEALDESIYDNEILNAYYKQLLSESNIQVYKAYYSKNYKNQLGQPYIIEEVLVDSVETTNKDGEKQTTSRYSSIRTDLDNDEKDSVKILK